MGLVSWGTEGDLRPFLALARALRARGHEVELVFTGIEGKDLTGLTQGLGVETHFADDGYFVRNREHLARLAQKSFHAAPEKQFELILSDLMDPVEPVMLAAARGLASRSDVVVSHFLAHPAAAAAAEHHKPFVMVALQPVFSSRFYPPAGMPALGWLNALTWLLADHVMRRGMQPRMNRTRAACGLPAVKRFAPATLGDPHKVLVAVSPALFPRPSDWDARIEVTGFFGLEGASTTWTPEPHVAAFLDAEPPVFLSFGSMFGLDDRQTMESVSTFAEALTLAKTRGIVQAPADVVARAPKRENVSYLVRAPHVALFPRCSAIVHHGGAGTTMSAVLAGKGSVVVPHAADQFYWADVLHARGVAAEPLRRPKLTAPALASRIRAVLDDPGVVPRATTLADALRSEDGTGHAVVAIERAAR